MPVLQNISFTAKQGRVTALVGPSGSGKTTISNLIARFWDVSNGDILIGGVNVKDLKNDTLLSYISIVFQDVYLFNDTILNNIKFGNSNATQEQVEAAAKAARCHEFILELPDGYNTPVGEGGSALSGGEKQRISIARAILKDAPIVLLDEATASIDPENELLIQQAIDSLVQSKTLIVIAHKLSTIKNADQILVIEGGKIIERGNHGELIKNGNLYSRFWSDRQQARSWKIEV
ncbi:MAG: ATP-binding cassette domain-containing protein [Oscillatoriales cyanobacterium]|nr:MAG: ATP-binding cassette domain-containing protein [Oscillatoriales cyanobacterium]